LRLIGSRALTSFNRSLQSLFKVHGSSLLGQCTGSVCHISLSGIWGHMNRGGPEGVSRRHFSHMKYLQPRTLVCHGYFSSREFAKALDLATSLWRAL
jgi:hypothetical protein